jgi:hypothetical protein
VASRKRISYSTNSARSSARKSRREVGIIIVKISQRIRVGHNKDWKGGQQKLQCSEKGEDISIIAMDIKGKGSSKLLKGYIINVENFDSDLLAAHRLYTQKKNVYTKKKQTPKKTLREERLPGAHRPMD